MTISSIVIVCSTVSLVKYQGKVDQNVTQTNKKVLPSYF
jgi:hypothetical protein